MMERGCFVLAAYGVTAVIVLLLCVNSYLHWRRIKSDYQRLFTRNTDDTNA